MFNENAKLIIVLWFLPKNSWICDECAEDSCENYRWNYFKCWYECHQFTVHLFFTHGISFNIHRTNIVNFHLLFTTFDVLLIMYCNLRQNFSINSIMICIKIKWWTSILNERYHWWYKCQLKNELTLVNDIELHINCEWSRDLFEI